jgi:hypothetical protein
MDRERTHEPNEGVDHPHDVSGPSNLDDVALMGNPDIRDDVAYRRGVPLRRILRGRREDRKDFVMPNRGASAETYTSEELRNAFDSEGE